MLLWNEALGLRKSRPRRSSAGPAILPLLNILLLADYNASVRLHAKAGRFGGKRSRKLSNVRKAVF